MSWYYGKKVIIYADAFQNQKWKKTTTEVDEDEKLFLKRVL